MENSHESRTRQGNAQVLLLRTGALGPVVRLGPVVQSILSLMSSLITMGLLTVVTKVFSNTLIFCCKNVSSFCNACKGYSHFFSAKNINVFAIFQDRNFKSGSLATSLSFELGPGCYLLHGSLFHRF